MNTAPILHWPATPSRPWVRERILATFAAGHCLLFGARASAGADHRAVEGAGWVYWDERGREWRYDNAHEAAACVLAKHSTDEIRRAMAWACRDEIAAAKSAPAAHVHITRRPVNRRFVDHDIERSAAALRGRGL